MLKKSRNFPNLHFVLDLRIFTRGTWMDQYTVRYGTSVRGVRWGWATKSPAAGREGGRQK